MLAVNPVTNDTNPQKLERIEKRAAIVGTAQSWIQTPWSDPGIDIFGLNDGYALGWRKGWAGLPRISGWYDLHPFSQMSFRPKNQTHVSAADVPTGAYLRPEGHLNWLRAQTVPVWVNQKPAGWPDHVREFPRAELEKQFGTYFTSTPAWMLAHLLSQGYTTIEIYGIHLATEYEYLSQRPCMEFWIARAIQMGCKIVLPAKCPLLKSKHVYAYEPKPDLPIHAVQTEMQVIKAQGAQLQKQLAACHWYEAGRKADLKSQLDVLNLELLDRRQAHSRAQAVAHFAA